MDPAEVQTVKVFSLLGLVLGLVMFAIGAAMLSDSALAGIILAGACSASYTWAVVGKRTVLSGLVGGVVGSVFAWVAMRSMMRWVATSSGLAPILTPEGTLAILATSLMMGVLPAMGYVHFVRRYGHSFKMALSYGVLLSGIGGVPILLLVSSEITSIAREPLIPVSFLLAVPVLFAFVVEAAERGIRGMESLRPAAE